MVLEALPLKANGTPLARLIGGEIIRNPQGAERAAKCDRRQ
jgi:hypothetical protein